MKAKVESWDSMKERYPDSFVLIENPEFKEKYSPELLKGIFRYKHKSKKMVVKKELELKPHHSIIQYTGGHRLDKFNEMAMVL
jgi:hypothetical protein